MGVDMGKAEFIHLHLHTQYSLLDGAIRLSDLFSLVSEYGMPAVAMTDHGNLFGAIDFYQTANDAGIKPIIGCEIYVAKKDFREKEPGSIRDNSNHLVLLVENEQGYKNLTRLLTLAHLEGFYYKPRVDKELLSQHADGLIALSACLKGEVAEKIVAGDEAGARETAGIYADIFPGRFYLELMENGVPEQRGVNRTLVSFSRELGLPLVATNDCHYLRREDAEAHDVLLCIQTGKTMSDPGRMRMVSDEFYVKSPAEMAEAFSDVPEALRNTVEIAERCNLTFTFGQFQFPEYVPPTGEEITDYFDRTVRDGFEQRISQIKERRAGDAKLSEREYRERLEHEIAVIKRMGFSGYFLIVSDFINYAKHQKIPVGPGRGSAAGSLVAYSLGITDIDPITYELLFERFLNPERISMPDIDIDFCKNGRDEVIKYVMEKYGGDDRVAQIITFGKMQARAVIRDVGRAMDMSYPEVDQIAKLIPAIPLNITLDEAVAAEPRLRELVETDQKIRRLVDIARSLEGLNRHSSTHAAGMVISNLPLVEYMPLARGQKGEVITQFDMKSVEKLGLIKFDFLGLRTLTVIDDTVKLIQKNRGRELDITEIPLDDPNTYRLLQSGDTDGVFQLESSGMKDLMTRLVPEKFEEVIALVALYRPGPLNTGMAEEFVKRKHSRDAIKYELPQLSEILGDTYGVMVYQEQVMQIASALANFSPADSDLLRRAMGKKIREEMASQKEKFVTGARANGIERATAERIFKLMEEFAEYGFNKSHSAAYAMVSYQTAYLKANYPVEFMASLLTSEMDDTDKIMKYIAKCRDMGINVMPPHINESGLVFSVAGDVIRFGLAAVKNVGGSAIESIVAARDESGDFQSLYDFTNRVDLRKVNKRVIESLIKCGAFDFTSVSRAKMMGVLDRAVELGQHHQEERRQGQMNIFEKLGRGDGGASLPEEYPEVPEWNDSKIMAFEKESLGFYITGHPLSEFDDLLRAVTESDTSTIGQKQDKTIVTLGGVVASIKEIITKKGERMAFMTIEDMKGTCEVIVFSDVYRQKRQLLIEDTPILVEGMIDKGEETVKLIAREIYPLTEIKIREKKQVYIDLEDRDLPAEQLEKLKKIILVHKGETGVVLRLYDQAHGFLTLSLPKELGVEPTTDFIDEVETLFSAGRVHVA
jgi:DNA polymerase-3 subunit alpha